MFLNDLLEHLEGQGADSAVLDRARAQVASDFPALFEAMWRQPMSTAQPDIDLPDDYALELMERLG